MEEFVLNPNNYNTNQLADFLRREIPNSTIVKINPVYLEIVKNNAKLRLLLTDQGKTITIKPKRNVFVFWIFFAVIMLPLNIIMNSLPQSGLYLGVVLTFSIYFIGFGIASLLGYIMHYTINKKKEERAGDFFEEIKRAFDNYAPTAINITNTQTLESNATIAQTATTLTTDELSALSVISPSILDTLNDAKRRKIIAFIKIMEHSDSIALYGNNQEVKRIDKDRWAEIIKQGLADKFHVIYQKS